MKKIPTIFKRDETDRSRVTDEINPVCQWVFDGEGVATRKFDGTAILIRGGRVFKRYDCKRGRVPPPLFEAASDDFDPVTGHLPGWVPMNKEAPEDKYLVEALVAGKTWYGAPLVDGTYELCGPKIQGNAEQLPHHALVKHGEVSWLECKLIWPLVDFFKEYNVEGIVWHHPDGRMAKIKARDFGIYKRDGSQKGEIT